MVTCMCSAPMGSVPPPIDMDELAIGIELDISGIGDLVWLAAAEVVADDEQAAATSASAPIRTAAVVTEPGRPRSRDLDMGRPPRCPDAAAGTITDGFEDALIDAPAAALIAHPPKKRVEGDRPGRRHRQGVPPAGRVVRPVAAAPPAPRVRPPGPAPPPAPR